MKNSWVTSNHKISIESTEGDWAEDGVERIESCPVCGCAERKVVHTGLKDRVFFCAPGIWTIHQCLGCGSGYIDPRPNSATIGRAYSSYYTHSAAPELGQTPNSAFRRHRIAKRNAYLNSTYGYSLFPAAKRVPKHVSTDRRQRWDKQICYLKFPGTGARLLEIGCGNGRLMAQMQAAGWRVSGVEPDAESSARAVASGLDVRNCSVETLKDVEEETFDAVILHHVIEHIHRPLETLRRCWAVLKSGGTIAVATPNFASFGHDKFCENWFALDPPRHLVLFTQSSLRQALESSGFKPEPRCRSRIGAKEIFLRSLQIQLGGDPMRMLPRPPFMQRLVAMFQARQADRATRRNPEFTEELMMLAHK
jgi:SAM-dependent methyltransferase